MTARSLPPGPLIFSLCHNSKRSFGCARFARCSHRGPLPSFLCMITMRAARASSTRAHAAHASSASSSTGTAVASEQTKLPSAAGPALPDNCPSRHPGSKRVTAERTREAWHTVQLYWVRLPPPERQLAAGPSRTAVRAACGASCQARRQTSIRHGAHGCGIGLLQSSPLRDARWGTQTLTAVRAAAALRAHSQGGYLGECIRGERTALRQAVLPNGTRPSSTVSAAVMRRLKGVVRTFLTLKRAGAPE